MPKGVSKFRQAVVGKLDPPSSPTAPAARHPTPARRASRRRPAAGAGGARRPPLARRRAAGRRRRVGVPLACSLLPP